MLSNKRPIIVTVGPGRAGPGTFDFLLDFLYLGPKNMFYLGLGVQIEFLLPNQLPIVGTSISPASYYFVLRLSRGQSSVVCRAHSEKIAESQVIFAILTLL